MQALVSGAPEVYLIMAATVCAVAIVVAGMVRDVYRAIMAAGLGFIALALLTAH
jgi:hypothetical protein